MRIYQAQRLGPERIASADQHEAPTNGAFEGNHSLVNWGLNAPTDPTSRRLDGP